jgi:hypothetical protein
MKTIYRVLLSLTILAIVGFAAASYVIEDFQYETIVKLYLSLANSPIRFVEETLASGNFTSIEVLAIGGGVLVLFLVSTFVLIKKFRQKRLLSAILSFVGINLLSFVVIAATVPYFSILNDGVNINRFVYYIGDLLRASPIDWELLVLHGGLTFAFVDFLLLISLHAVFSKPASKKVKLVKVKPTKVVDKKVAVQPTVTVVETVQAKSQVAVQPAVATDASLAELVRLVMAEEIQNMKQPNSTFTTQLGQTDGALIRRIVAEELARFQIHFISRAEVQTILAQEIALLKLSLNIK